MPWTQYVPRTQYSRVDVTGTNECLPFLPHSHVSAHNRRRLGDTHVDHVPYRGLYSRGHRSTDGHEVNRAKLLGLGRIRLRRPDEMYEGISGWDG